MIQVVAGTMLLLAAPATGQFLLTQTHPKAKATLVAFGGASPRRVFAQTTEQVGLPEARVAHLRVLMDNWDGEGAPRPSTTAIDHAAVILDRIDKRASLDAEIDADVIGGASIWLAELDGDRRVWISCMNTGETTIVMTEGETIERSVFDEKGLDRAIAFLMRNRRGLS